jgi:uncharacterized damage-inducible protein DinB
VLEHVLHHNNWANLTLLDFCREVDPAILDMGARGTYGTVYGTLQHVIGGQQWYVQLLTGDVLGTPIRRTERRTLEELIAVAQATGDRVLRVVKEDDPDRRVEMNEGRTSTVGVIVAQIVHHGNEHRTQVTTILGVNGIQPPPISAWGYGRAAKISEAEE